MEFRKESVIESERTTIIDTMMEAARLKTFFMSWDPSRRVYSRVYENDAPRYVKVKTDDALNRAVHLLHMMALPADEPIASLVTQADELDIQANRLEERVAKMREMASGLRKCAKKL